MKRDFEEVFEQGQKNASQFTVIYAKPNCLNHSRLGLSVNRRLGNAVVRNRIKRRIREILRKHLAKNPLHYDLVFVARKDSVSADFDKLEKKISDFLLSLNNEKITDNNHKAL